jgi:hypothetical protein
MRSKFKYAYTRLMTVAADKLPPIAASLLAEENQPLVGPHAASPPSQANWPFCVRAKVHPRAAMLGIVRGDIPTPTAPGRGGRRWNMP